MWHCICSCPAHPLGGLQLCHVLADAPDLLLLSVLFQLLHVLLCWVLWLSLPPKLLVLSSTGDDGWLPQSCSCGSCSTYQHYHSSLCCLAACPYAPSSVSFLFHLGASAWACWGIFVVVCSSRSSFFPLPTHLLVQPHTRLSLPLPASPFGFLGIEGT
jgi:hypothetical protein